MLMTARYKNGVTRGLGSHAASSTKVLPPALTMGSEQRAVRSLQQHQQQLPQLQDVVLDVLLPGEQAGDALGHGTGQAPQGVQAGRGQRSPHAHGLVP